MNRELHLSILKTVNVSAAPSGCECIVCGEVPFEPTICRNCEFVFCTLCLKTWLVRNPTCPQCRQSIEVDKLSQSKLAQRTINDLVATCTNEGCDLQAKYEVMCSHVSVCGHGVIKCPNDNCTYYSKRTCMDEHRKDCPYEKEPCSCGDLVARNGKEVN
jgi:hypothetical protein